MLEWSEDDKAKLDVHIHDSGAMADETFGGCQKIVETDAKTNLLYDLPMALKIRRLSITNVLTVADLICIFLIDIVNNGLMTLLAKVCRVDLNQIGDLRLEKVRIHR
jgi:hypothetical protein